LSGALDRHPRLKLIIGHVRSNRASGDAGTLRRKIVEFVQQWLLRIGPGRKHEAAHERSVASDGRLHNEEAHVMPIHGEAANRATTIDPAKLLEIVRRWCPASPVEVPIALVKALIEAAASSSR
jgi:hypothetical protein